MTTRYDFSSLRPDRVLAECRRNAAPPKVPLEPIEVADRGAPRNMVPLRAYRGPGFVLVRFDNEDDVQEAVNHVQAALPAEPPPDKWEWILILPQPSVTDPMAQSGYVGAKVPRPKLKAGEFLVRTWKKGEDGVQVPTDVVATQETLEALRRDPQYTRVQAPKDRQ